MVFKPDKNLVLAIILGYIFAFVFLTIMIILALISNSEFWWLYILLYGLFLIVSLKMFQTYGSSLRMDENGCSLEFLWIKKKYRWCDLKTIRVEDLRATFDMSCYEKCIVFSTKQKVRPFVHVSPFKRIGSYNFFKNTFVVYFVKYNKEGKRNDSGALWACDEEEMLAKLKEWGIEPEFRVYNY